MLIEWMKTAPAVSADAREGFDPEAVTTSETLDIAAPASIVWQVLTDMARYGEWNPFCVRAESTLQMGAPVFMSLVNYAVPGTLVPNCEYICALEPDRMISWTMPWSQAWPYPARRDQIIAATGAESCRYFTTDAFLGETGIHVHRFAGPWIKRAFDDSARALKQRAETLYTNEERA
jgi:hypothetical protein